MNDTNLSSRYYLNEIPNEQKKIDEFGYKACNLSLAKKWQFPVPETVFLSGGLVREIFEKKCVPAEILSHFKNKLLAIRPSPVTDLSAKNEPFLYIGLDDRSYEILKKTVGIKSITDLLKLLRMFSSTVYNLDLETVMNFAGY